MNAPASAPFDCPDTCSLSVTVEAGRIAKVHGSDAAPSTAGVICNKVAQEMGAFVHGPQRLLHPLRRTGPKGSGQFEPISWDAALDEIHARVGAVIERWGPEAVTPLNYAGPHGFLEIDAAKWKLKVGGEGVGKSLELGLSELRSSFEAVEVAAVCQCSGNRRGFSEPHVAGVQWGLGAVGNALWKGVRLKEVLNRANLRPETAEIVVNGADGPVLDGTPDFIKSIPVDKALDDNTLIAYEMNGAPLPHYNGFPIRLIVPGWTATYWMKHLDTIEALTKPFGGFWMKSAYRIPSAKFPIVQHFLSQMTTANEPITEMVVNSMITAPQEGHTMRAAETADIRGLAWDGGYGIGRVEISVDRGETWREAALGKDVGRFGFRSFQFPFTPARAGKYQLMARASNGVGQIQADKLIFNPAGYHNNVIRPLTIDVT